MNIYQQKLLEGLKPNASDAVPNGSDIRSLLHLVIPSSDGHLPPLEAALTNSYNPMEDPFMPQSPSLSLQTTSFRSVLPLPADLNELIIAHNVEVVAEPMFHPAQNWIESPSFSHPSRTFSIEVPPSNPMDSHELLELFKDMDSVQDKSKLKRKQQQQQLLCKKAKGQCEVAGCNTKMQSKGRCIRHGGGRRCVVEGCTRGAQTMRRCKRHGGGARCKVEGCGTSSQGGGLCRAHGGGKLCTAPGCKKGAQRQGKCATHSSQKCRIDDCSSVARCRGLCSRHKRQKLHV